MSTGRVARSRTGLLLLAGPAVLLLTVLLPARPAAAHPLDVYLLSSYVTLAQSRVALEIDMSPGVLVAPAVLAELDPAGDQQVTDARARAYAAAVLGQVEVRVDDRPVTLALTKVDVPPYQTIKAGYGTLRVYANPQTRPLSPGPQVLFRNDFAPPGVAYQVNAFVAAAAPVVLGAQHRDAGQQQSAIDYRIDPAATPADSPARRPARPASCRQRRPAVWSATSRDRPSPPGSCCWPSVRPHSLAHCTPSRPDTARH